MYACISIYMRVCVCVYMTIFYLTTRITCSLRLFGLTAGSAALTANPVSREVL